MKKIAYIAPKATVVKIEGQIVMNAISTPTTTSGADGLGISDDSFEDDARVKGSVFDW